MLSTVLACKIALVAMFAGSVPATTKTAFEHKIYGTVTSVSGNTLVIRTRVGKLLTVDGSRALSAVLLRQNRPVIVYGTLDPSGILHARAVWRTFPDAAHWPADR